MSNIKDTLAEVPADRIQTVMDVVKDAAGNTSVTHVRKYGSYTSLLTVLPNTGGAQFVVDENAKNGVETVYYKPTYSPQFSAWQQKFGNVMGMDKFRDFITERSSEVVQANIEVIKKVGSKEVQDTEAVNVRSLRRMLSTIVVSSSQKAFSGVGAEALNGVIIKTSVRSASDIESSITLPESIVVNLPIFVDDLPEQLGFDLDVQALSAEKAGIRMTFGQLEAHRAKRAYDLLKAVETVGAELGCVAGYGEARHEAWQYITG